ncbi:MAG: regulatory signaling modulator protein AmpE [Chromatiales bacterium]|nr:regulatory signaling modulator protein AmpE [Chromatiales bacterium]
MSFLAIFLALVAERFLLPLEGRRQLGWLTEYFVWARRILYPFKGSDGPLGVVLVLVPVLLVLSTLIDLLDGVLFGIPAFLFSAVVLLYCLGPRDLGSQVEAFTEAAYRGDTVTARELGREIIGRNTDEGLGEVVREVTSAVFRESNERLFAPVFWFLILGPMGAGLYRASAQLRRQAAGRDKPESTFLAAGSRLLWILDWVPARLTAVGFLLTGNFEKGLYDWKMRSDEEEERSHIPAEALLEAAGHGALQLEPGTGDNPPLPSDQIEPVLAKAAMGMVWRTLLIWLLLMGIAAISSWVG